MAVFQQQEEVSVASELHAIVDNLQLDAPQVEPPRRPFWQRPLVWQVPLFLIVLAIVTLYNPRVDNCNGFKITYKKQVLCISDDADFFLFVEHFTCDVIEKGVSVADSLKIDAAAQPKMAAYFEKHDFSLEKQPIEAEVLRGMRGVYDSTSFCKNITKVYWNLGVRYSSLNKQDSACYYFKKIYDWTWKDSVLTAEEQRLIKENCDITSTKKNDATALNSLNNRRLNINNLLQQRVSQRGNSNRILNKVGDKNIAPQQQTTPTAQTDPSVKTGKVPPKALAKDAVLGFNLYNGNRVMTLSEWQEVAKTYKFVYIKASEGTNIKDEKLDEFAQKAARVGMAKGVYHVYHLTNNDVNAQLQNFLQTINYSKNQFEMPPVVTIEPDISLYKRDGSIATVQKDSFAQNLKQFLRELERQTRKRPVIYTNGSIWNDFLGNPTGFERYPLWVADYAGTDDPKLPTNWQNYTIWQYVENAAIAGQKEYNINVFNGNYADFQQFIKSSNVGQSKF